MRFYKFGFISLLVICFFLVSSSIAYAGVNLSTWTLDDTSGNDLLRFVYPSNNPAFVVNTNGNVGIGTTNPGAKLHSLATTEQLRLGYDATNYSSFTTNSSGHLTINPSGSLTNLTSLVSINTNNGGEPLTITTSANSSIGAVINNSNSGTSAMSRLLFQGNGNYADIGYTSSTFSDGTNYTGIGANTLLIANRANAPIVFNTNGIGSSGERMRITGGGNVGIGTSSPHGGLHVRRSVVGGYAGTFQNTAGGAGDPGVQIYAGTSTSGTYIQFYPADGSVTQGSISQSGGNTLYNATSDIRLKEYITDTHVGLTDLMKISVKNYTMKSDPTHTVNTGFIAQELYEIYPNAVSVPKTPEQYWGVDYGKLTPLLVKSMQEQQKKIENQQKEIDSLNKEINEIKSLLKK